MVLDELKVLYEDFGRPALNICLRPGHNFLEAGSELKNDHIVPWRFLAATIYLVIPPGILIAGIEKNGLDSIPDIGYLGLVPLCFAGVDAARGVWSYAQGRVAEEKKDSAIGLEDSLDNVRIFARDNEQDYEGELLQAAKDAEKNDSPNGYSSDFPMQE